MTERKAGSGRLPHRVLRLRPQDVERFWPKVRRGDPGACWPWLASFPDRGYGIFWLPRLGMKVALHGRPWVRAVRLSTLEEDQRGVDIVVETDRDDIYVQVKSSVGGASKYRRQYGASPDLARTVVVIMGPGRGSEVATQIAGKVNDIWRKMGGAEARTSPPRPAPPAPLPSTVNGPATQWQAMVDGANRRAERARAHAEAAIRDNNRLRQALRVAVLGLRELDGAAPALAAIERAAPGMTSEQFCFPERFTREERQAAALARDAGEDS